jgi:hypothetical protein
VPAGGATGQVLAKASATDHDTQWVTPATGGGAVLAKKAIAATSDASGTDVIPLANRPPAATAGWAYTPLTLTHALANAANRLHIRVAIPAVLSTWTTAYLFLCQSGEANAIRVAASLGATTQLPFLLELDAVVAPGTTAARTYTVRLGMGARGTLFVNRSGNYPNLFGDALQATMSIEEFAP